MDRWTPPSFDADPAPVAANTNASSGVKVSGLTLPTVDEIQANAILDMQLRRIAALERQKINDEYDGLMKDIIELNAILVSPEKQREIIKTELSDLVAKYGDERRTQIVASEGDFSAEDLIPDQDAVVTITRTGYAKRTNADLYKTQRRGGRGVKGAALKQDDVVDHFFVASTHDWLLFFTNQGRVYRAKVHELPDAGRDARGQHVANLMAFTAKISFTAKMASRSLFTNRSSIKASKFFAALPSRISTFIPNDNFSAASS